MLNSGIQSGGAGKFIIDILKHYTCIQYDNCLTQTLYIFLYRPIGYSSAPEFGISAKSRSNFSRKIRKRFENQKLE